MALTHLGVLMLVVASATAAPTPQTIAHIHGRIVSIDPKTGTFQIHHDPFPMMPMAMTMPVAPKNPADLKKLHVGEVIDATIDTSIDPWPGTNIRPAAPKASHTP
jgi:Cu/Ag efflux protein CusF